MERGLRVMHLCIIKARNKKHQIQNKQNTHKMKNTTYKTEAAKKIALFASILVCIVTAVNI